LRFAHCGARRKRRKEKKKERKRANLVSNRASSRANSDGEGKGGEKGECASPFVAGRQKRQGGEKGKREGGSFRVSSSEICGKMNLNNKKEGQGREKAYTRPYPDPSSTRRYGKRKKKKEKKSWRTRRVDRKSQAIRKGKKKKDERFSRFRHTLEAEKRKRKEVVGRPQCANQRSRKEGKGTASVSKKERKGDAAVPPLTKVFYFGVPGQEKRGDGCTMIARILSRPAKNGRKKGRITRPARHVEDTVTVSHSRKKKKGEESREQLFPLPLLSTGKERERESRLASPRSGFGRGRGGKKKKEKASMAISYDADSCPEKAGRRVSPQYPGRKGKKRKKVECAAALYDKSARGGEENYLSFLRCPHREGGKKRGKKTGLFCLSPPMPTRKRKGGAWLHWPNIRLPSEEKPSRKPPRLRLPKKNLCFEPSALVSKPISWAKNKKPIYCCLGQGGGGGGDCFSLVENGWRGGRGKRGKNRQIARAARPLRKEKRAIPPAYSSMTEKKKKRTKPVCSLAHQPARYVSKTERRRERG